MNVHRIRLKGFWVRTPRENGGVRIRRPFGRPRTLDPHERLWIVGPVVLSGATVWLNGHCLGIVTAGQTFEFEITSIALPRNEVVVEMNQDDPLDEAAIEIRG
jgi:hypothetical protein